MMYWGYKFEQYTCAGRGWLIVFLFCCTHWVVTVPCKIIHPTWHFSPLALFCFITTCNLNGFLFGFHVMDMHKIVKNYEL
jgi:hypothetical protein